MAKAKKGPRQIFGLKCTVCSNFNYITERNKLNTPDKLVLNKYCKICKKATDHKESTKLK
jgi:large subunit ribosomal protein L33